MVIYLDVLLLSNWWIDFFLLKSVAHITHTPCRKWRLLTAAAIGACSALLIFLPPMSLFVGWLVRITTAFLMCIAAFCPCPWKRLVQTGISLFVAAMIFCGVVYTVGSRIAPRGITTANGILYADVSLGVLLIATVIAACITTYTARRKQNADISRYTLQIRLRDRVCRIQALCDSGNRLCDPFSGLPVIVCNAKSLQEKDAFLDAEQFARGEKAFRMLQADTVTGKRLLPACIPEAITIYDRNKAYPVKAVIAVSDEAIPAVFSPILLP